MTKVMKEMIGTLLYLLGALIVIYLLINFVGQRTKVDGPSMENTLFSGDNLIVDKLTYHFRDPERFDIIVFPPKNMPNAYYIKRIIGLPGETVQIDQNGNIYINGEILEESYGREIIRPELRGVAAQPVTLGDDEYFVMGDNRNNSTDSRMEIVGNIKREDIVGRAFIRIWPLSRFGIIKHE